MEKLKFNIPLVTIHIWFRCSTLDCPIKFIRIIILTNKIQIVLYFQRKIIFNITIYLNLIEKSNVLHPGWIYHQINYSQVVEMDS